MSTLITVLRNIRSVLMLPSCRLVPSCSTYIKVSLERHGYVYGGLLAARRILRCHPLSRTMVDPVPEAHAG